MTKGERRNLYFSSDMTVDTPLCINCKHFYRHYLKCGYELIWGHCVYPRIKSRLAFDTCEHFQKTKGRNATNSLLIKKRTSNNSCSTHSNA